MNNKKGFTLVELIVSFALITAVSLAFFKTILVLQQEQLKNIAKNSYKAFTVVLNNSIQKDFLNDNIEKIISCGENCYDITYTTNGIVRLSIDKEKNTITYGNIKEKLPKDYKFINNIEFTSYINSYEGNDSYIALNLNLKSSYEKKIENIKYVYQYDSDNGIIELNVDGAAASDIIEYLLYKSPEENGLYEPLLPDGTSTGIRYRGSNPNNYVYFNCEDTDSSSVAYGEDGYDYANSCEVWRIIGVFDVDNGKGNIEKRVKLVKGEILNSSMPWGDTEISGEYVNQWGKTTLTTDNVTEFSGSSLMKYLNDNKDGNYYYSLSSNTKSQIDDVLWYTGAVLKETSSVVYENERSDMIGRSTMVNYTTTWVGTIGLIYPSDFAYAGINCGDYTIYDYANSCGATNNWLTYTTSYWTISPSEAYNNRTWYVRVGGYAASYFVNKSLGVRPSLYLKSNVTFIENGNGTEDAPYILGINE